MLPQACPECGTPLFQMPSKEIWCPSCDKRVVIIRESETPSKAMGMMQLESIEESLLSKIQDVHERIKKEKDVDEIGRLIAILSKMLEALERLRKFRLEGKS